MEGGSKQLLSDIDIGVKLLFGTESEKKHVFLNGWQKTDKMTMKAREWCFLRAGKISQKSI